MLTKPLEKSYTFTHYKGFDDDYRCEIINGVVYAMSPALLGFLHATLWNYLKGKPCKVFLAPLDVFLIDENQEPADCNKIVQPDISVICDKNKLSKEGCIGAPDLIIEITSPSNKAHDYVRKLNLYNEYKVRSSFLIIWR